MFKMTNFQCFWTSNSIQKTSSYSLRNNNNNILPQEELRNQYLNKKYGNAVVSYFFQESYVLKSPRLL